MTNELDKKKTEAAILAEIKRDKSHDPETMKLPTPQEMEHVDTVAEFMERPPSFCIGEVFVDCTVQLPGAGKKQYKAGTRLCLTPYCYKQMAGANRPCVKPADIAFRDVFNRYCGQDLTGKHLMAWRGGGIGDLLFIRPILAHLKRKYNCKITFATKAQYHDMLMYWDDAIDELTDINFDADKTLLKADYHLTFEGSIERIKEANERDVHEIFAELCGLDPNEIEWSVPMEVPVDNPFFIGDIGKFIVVQARSSAAIRTPFAGTFVRAINAATKRGYKVVMVDSPQMHRHVEDIRTTCNDPHMVINFCDISKGLHDSVELVNRAACVVAPDSAFTHLAAMQGVPSIALYGSFPGKCRTVHYPLCVTIETQKSNVCKFGGRECFLHAPWGKCEANNMCWGTIDDALVVESLDAMLDAVEGE